MVCNALTILAPLTLRIFPHTSASTVPSHFLYHSGIMKKLTNFTEGEILALGDSL